MADAHDPPDIYADQVALMTTEWGVILSLYAILPHVPVEIHDAAEAQGVQTNVRVPTELRGIVRLSHGHAKTLSILLKRMLKTYEEQIGEIPIPAPVIARHTITPEDWA